MNYDQPREKESGGWHYTRFNRRVGTWPIGYCRDHEPHATPDEARECYTKYMLAECVRLDATLGEYNPCRADGCDILTNRAAAVGEWNLYRLCDVHRTREQVAVLFGTVGDSVHS